MLKLKILSVGKTKEKWLEDGCSEYVKRMKPKVHIEFCWAKDDVQLIQWAQKESGILCLDPQGKSFTSEAFSQYLFSEWEQHGSQLTVIIGGAEGIPYELKKKTKLISLSSLTFTHQMTRLIIMEQIYRAFEIQKNSSYHK